MANHTRRVIIVGAGIAGLAAALRLGEAGWSPLLIERAPERRGGGYALNLSGLGYDAAERMGLLPALTERAVDAFELAYVTAAGRPRFTVPSRTVQAVLGERNATLLRGDIEAVLYDAVRARVCDPVPIRFGVTVDAVAQDADGVRVTLGDGTTEDADLLIGADGLHSRVRELVFGPEREFRRDLNHLIAAFTVDELPAGVRERAFTSVAAVGRTMSFAHLGPGRMAAFFTHGSPDPDAELAMGARAALTRAYGDLGWIVPDLLAGLDSGSPVYFDSVSQMVVDQWIRGRVVLLGDAAWCVTLFAGYGASLALGGADRLGLALEHQPADIPAALRAWDAELRPMAEKHQRRGRRNTGLHAPTGRLELFLREVPLRLAALPPVTRILQHRLHRA
ncbi:FAD-dependent monooxygenase [Actinopolymorpha alba]|uniref:FAD-dependent monooxygenase n=1 Tax=Actinopolymorpha alba TaxID=533267 RepID=UPI00036626D3|nr:FAD-dependent monooxygenase [Actinopolymorpha alba]